MAKTKNSRMQGAAAGRVISDADADRIDQIALLLEHAQQQLVLMRGLYENVAAEDRSHPPGLRNLTIESVLGGVVSQMDQMDELLAAIGSEARP